MHTHHQKSQALNEPRPPLAPAPKPAPKLTPLASYYDSQQVAQERRARKLALENHTTPALDLKQQRKQLKSRITALLRELQPIENELAAVRQQLAALK